MGWILKATIAGAILSLSVGGTLLLARGRPPQRRVAVERVTPSASVAALRSEPAKVLPLARPAVPPPTLHEEHPLTQALCPEGMNWVTGQYCPGPPSGGACAAPVRDMGFCMDKHEYPNQLGVVPAVMISFTRSEALCAAEGKRLCFDSEWTFACRSTTELPGCNVGHSIAPVIPRRFWDPSAVASELERVDARRVSQATTCATPAGIFDLPGNVREWVRSEHVAQYPAAIKGPGYNESSIDCERSIQTRLPEQAYPHTGLRCCTEPLVAVPGGP